MKVTKSEVKWFISKVQEKAVKAVRDDYAKREKELIENWLKEHPRVPVIFKEMEEGVQALTDNFKELKEYFDAGAYIGGLNPVEYSNGFNAHKTFFGLREVPSSLLALKSLRVEKHNAETKTIQEYEKIVGLIVAARNGKVAVKILADLGFDVSYFEREEAPKPSVKIDAGVLFPCRERGLNNETTE